jgi:hypothetical protein
MDDRESLVRRLLNPEFETYKNPAGEVISEKDIATRVSKLAAENPKKFVAEVFAGMMAGRKFDQDVMELYRKFLGPEL